MRNELQQSLSDLSEGKFDYLKLSCVNVFKRQRTVELCFIYPIERESDLADDKEQIEKHVKDILCSELSVGVRFIKSSFFIDTFTDELISFLNGFPSISSVVTKENIIVENKENVKNIFISLSESLYNYAVESDILQKTREYFSIRYCEDLKFQFVPLKEEARSTENIERFVRKMSSAGVYLESGGSRIINVDNREEFIGTIIYDEATYISDARSCERIVLCGTIEDFTVLLRKPKTPDDKSDKKFYKFKLRDFTGAISCLYFPSQKTENIIMGLNDGKSIIVVGRIQEDNYNNSNSLVLTVKNITLCTLPSKFRENRIMCRVGEEYLTVKPEAYVMPVQSSLFETKTALPPSLSGKRFCVFDLETTGLDPKNNEIMEIGAVIVENGEIKQTFYSFVSISGMIPDKIKALTGITDGDLVGRPSVKEVLTDFFKFSYGIPLVGQNVSFDYGFISAHGAKHHIHFDNERIDTIALARRYLKNMKNFTLKSIADKLEIKNEGAHRALNDAIATAQVFIKLSNMA